MGNYLEKSEVGADYETMSYSGRSFVQGKRLNYAMVIVSAIKWKWKYTNHTR